MPIPEEIRQVKRPTNTVVKKIGNKYAVIERIGCKRIKGTNRPVEGKVVGHIVDGVYIEKKTALLALTLKNYANFIVADSLGKNLLDELKQVYDDKSSIDIYCVSLLRAINPKLTDNQISDEYEESFMSETYKNLKLGKSKVSSFVEALGKDFSKILQFMQNRVNSIDEKNKLAIDGTLKTNNSKINSLSDFSYKGRIKSSKDISLIVAFDITTKEIICSLPYQGNEVDTVTFPDFIEKTGIKTGIVITDKAGTYIDNDNNIGYIHPLKRSNKLLKELNIYDMDEVLKDKENPVLCKKVKRENLYYYAYRDLHRASKEKCDFITGKKFDKNKLDKKDKLFGTVVYVSNQDLTLEEAYNLYKDRWEIELVNKFYKENISSNVREHTDYSVYGSEFINFLSAVIANRMKNKFSESGLFKAYTYGEIMKFLARGKKVKLPGKEDWKLITQTKKGLEVLKALNI